MGNNIKNLVIPSTVKSVWVSEIESYTNSGAFDLRDVPINSRYTWDKTAYYYAVCQSNKEQPTADLYIPKDCLHLSIHGIKDITGLKIPPKLLHLSLGCAEQGLENLKLDELKTLETRNAILKDFKFPPKLKHLSLGCDQDLSKLELPNSITHLDIGSVEFDHLPKFPKSLKVLNLGHKRTILNYQIPDNVGAINFGYMNSIVNVKIPPNVNKIFTGVYNTFKDQIFPSTVKNISYPSNMYKSPKLLALRDVSVTIDLVIRTKRGE